MQPTSFLYGLLISATGVFSVLSQTFEFTAGKELTNGEMELTLAAPTGRAYRIETGNQPGQWSGLFTFPTNTLTSLRYTDAAAPYLGSRLYRATRVDGTNIVSGDHLVTTNGDVIIQPRNHATLVMQWNGQMIYVDPVAAATYTGLPKADMILVTHSHSDHFNSGTIETVRRPDAWIILPRSATNGLTATQRTRAIILGYGETTNVFGVTVEAVHAYNSSHSPPGFGNGYVLNIADKRVYISGDTGNVPEIRALPDIDVAFLCMNQPFTMTVNDATNAVLSMLPKVVYPYHYRDQGGSTANAALFKQRLGTNASIEVRLRTWY